MGRPFGCLIVLLGVLLASVGVIVLWLIASLFGLASAEGPLADLARPAGLVTLLVGLAAGVAGIRLTRGVAGPLGDLVDAAGAVEGGEYATRVAVPDGGPAELRKLARAFNTMTERLEAADASRRGLLAEVSHELRTPLAVIRGNLEGLIDGIYPADEAHLRPILEETEVLARLIEDLRTLSLAEAGSLPLHREATELGGFLDDIASAHRARADGAGIELSVDVDDDARATSVNVDPVRLRQVLANLIDNALKSVPRGGHVRLQAESAAGGFIRFAVVDDGPGIPEELRAVVFERFTRAPGSRGSGLGLAIARAIVEAHGGRISAGPGLDGVGTRVILELPTA